MASFLTIPRVRSARCRDDKLTPALAAPCRAGTKTGACGFLDQVALELAECSDMWTMSRPRGAVVSIVSINGQNPTPCHCSAATVPIGGGRTIVSIRFPDNQYLAVPHVAKRGLGPERSARAPEARSMDTSTHAAASATSRSETSFSSMLTRT